MSFDLYIWKAPVPTTEHDAHLLLDRHFAGDRSAFERSEDLSRFYRDLGGVVHDLDALGDRTDRLITLNLLWGTDDSVLRGIGDLVSKYQLVLYDPQRDKLHRPESGDPPPVFDPSEANPPWWRRLFGTGS